MQLQLVLKFFTTDENIFKKYPFGSLIEFPIWTESLSQ